MVKNMTIQNQFNNEALNMLPEIVAEIKKADQFGRDQIISKTLRECSNSRVSLINMNEKQLNEFQDNLLESFRYLEWIK
tara:strand:+ start:868 stop:1104 length:237 start_codon:yes stop_codon:yes gene_type:complete